MYRIKTFIYIGVSLDGFIARSDGNLDWLIKFESPEVHKSYSEFISNIDAVVIGRGTFEKVLSFPGWPYERPVFVLSSSLKHLPDSLEGKVKIISMKPKEVLHFLSGKGFSSIYVDGGKVIQQFLKENCIAEMIISRVPVLIGSGIPLFGFLERDLHFKHMETRVYSNGLVKSHYERIENNFETGIN